MQITNPFKSLIKSTNPEKKKLEKEMSKQAMEITKKVITRKCKITDVEKLEKMYDKYFEKFPNPKEESYCRERIRKLKIIAT